MNFDPSVLRAEFQRLGEIRDAVMAKVDPLEEKRNKIRAKAHEAEQVLVDEIKRLKAEAGLFDLDNKRAMICRALSGRTSAPVVAEAE